MLSDPVKRRDYDNSLQNRKVIVGLRDRVKERRGINGKIQNLILPMTILQGRKVLKGIMGLKSRVKISICLDNLTSLTSDFHLSGKTTWMYNSESLHLKWQRKYSMRFSAKWINCIYFSYVDLSLITLVQAWKILQEVSLMNSLLLIHNQVWPERLLNISLKIVRFWVKELSKETRSKFWLRNIPLQKMDLHAHRFTNK